MKNQALFSLKDKSKKLKCCLLQFLFGALRVKSFFFGIFMQQQQKNNNNNNRNDMQFLYSCIFIIGSL